MSDRLGAQPDAIVNGAFEGRNAESIQKNFEKIFRRLRQFDGGALGVPQEAEEGDITYFDGESWVSLPIGTTADVLTVSGSAPAWAAPATQADYMGLVAQAQWAMFGRAVGGTALGLGIANPTATGTVAQANAADSTYISNTTAAGAGSGAALIGVAGACQLQHDPILNVHIRTDASITGARFFFGLTDANFTNADEPGGTSDLVAFRYSTVVPDSGWVGLSRDGTTASVTAQVAAIAVSTAYRLTIRVSGAGTSVAFSVNGGTEVIKTTNLPGATVDLFPWFGVFNTAGVARVWHLSRAHCRYGS